MRGAKQRREEERERERENESKGVKLGICHPCISQLFEKNMTLIFSY